ncbi:hypothetical protein CAPTEDRAFT_201049 [Capitella teleta]|uniref:Uncharacterized protein n=1 Tax=Capitella teleta TaxID=283909 RepID=R7TH06_CAPTE|nr:hypothetical protein CAPTEDRAFT_201049 [Capitella teleta]|eukprot:ELT93098.1 hypothetical protein CAPTEDRAFT_201049 [Capitella teleta]
MAKCSINSKEGYYFPRYFRDERGVRMSGSTKEIQIMIFISKNQRCDDETWLFKLIRVPSVGLDATTDDADWPTPSNSSGSLTAPGRRVATLAGLSGTFRGPSCDSGSSDVERMMSSSTLSRHDSCRISEKGSPVCRETCSRRESTYKS